MEDIPNFVLYIFLVILTIILILFVLKYKYHWIFKLDIGKTEGFNNSSKEKVINDVVKNVENKINEIDNKDKNEKKDEDNKKTIEELVDEKVKEKLNELKLNNEIIMTNDDKQIIKKHYYPYNVMLNEPIGRMKQSKLMIDQLVNKNLERYYSYVKPIAIDDKEYKSPFNANTFCIKCDSKDQEYSSYFYADPLEYQNDKLEGENQNEGIKAYNV